LLLEQARKHQPAAISINDPSKAKDLQNAVGKTPVYSGEEGLLKLATLPEAHIVLIAMSARPDSNRRWLPFVLGKTLPWRRRKSS